MGLFSKLFGKKAEANSTVEFDVSLSCGKCVTNVENLLSNNKAVVESRVDLASKTVALQYDNTMTDEKTLQSSIESLGFEVSKKQ